MKVQKTLFSPAVQRVLLTSCIFLGAGCSSNDSMSENTSSSGPSTSEANTTLTSNPAAAGPGEQTANHPFADALAGTWLAPCDNSSSGSSKQQQLMVSGTTAVMTVREYSDLNCQTPAIPMMRELTFSLVFPGGTTTTPLGEATHVDLTPESSTIDGQPPTAEQAAQMPSETAYDIFLIADATLYTGHGTEELNGSTADKRPDTLQSDSEFLFVRQ